MNRPNRPLLLTHLVEDVELRVVTVVVDGLVVDPDVVLNRALSRVEVVREVALVVPVRPLAFGFTVVAPEAGGAGLVTGAPSVTANRPSANPPGGPVRRTT